MLYSDTSDDFKKWYQGQIKSMSLEQKAYKALECKTANLEFQINDGLIQLDLRAYESDDKERRRINAQKQRNKAFMDCDFYRKVRPSGP